MLLAFTKLGDLKSKVFPKSCPEALRPDDQKAALVRPSSFPTYLRSSRFSRQSQGEEGCSSV